MKHVKNYNSFNNSIVTELLRRNNFENYRVYEQAEIEYLVKSKLINTINLDDTKNNVIFLFMNNIYVTFPIYCKSSINL